MALCAVVLVGCPEDTEQSSSDSSPGTTGSDVSGEVGGESDVPTTGDDTTTSDVTDPAFSVDICVVSDLPGAAACEPITELDFGDVPVGTSKNLRVQIRNDSSGDVRLDSVDTGSELITASAVSSDDLDRTFPVTLTPDETVFVDVTVLAGLAPGDLPTDEATFALTVDGQSDSRPFSVLGTIVDCPAGTASCDDDWQNGCEITTDTDNANCGACGIPCAPDNATASCTAGSCEIADCNPGFFGTTCAPCPGETAPCSDNGVCADGVTGAGTCACDTGAEGDACAVCVAGYFGPGCDACPGSGDGTVCSEHGTCADLVDGTGECTCETGWSGDDCATDVDECLADAGPCDANAVCTNSDGAFECVCNDGWTGDGATCADVDECVDGSFECVIGAGCINGDGSFECACLDGFDGDGATCTPSCDAGFAPSACLAAADAASCVQGCKDAVCAIAASCCDTEWTDACSSCAAGGAGPDNADCSSVSDTCGICLDLDECAGEGDGNNCDANATCANTDGDFGCTCDAGYEGDGVACTDLDECLLDTDDCSDNGTCTNTDGGFDCACNAGYAGDGVTCGNVDECVDNAAGCDANATCTDSDGSFACECNAGYSGDGLACTNDDECADGGDGNNCAANSACTDTDGSFDCACDAGFEGAAINVCAGDDCLDTTCRDAVAALDGFCAGSWDTNCASCAGGGAGFGGLDCAAAAASCGGGCVDMDECAGANGGHDCDANATCANLPGTFMCACNEGWVGDGTDGGCANADECAGDGAGNNCAGDGICTDNVGSFECSCGDGFIGDGVGQCQGDSCPAGACLDAVCALDSFCCNNWDDTCASCAAGGFGFGGLDCSSVADTCGGCDDVDECTDGTHDCDANAGCTNTDGDFTCACNAGWMGDGTDGSCVDIDECTDGSNDCDANAACTNIDGSFTCACNDGFDGDGTACTDINECDAATDNCDDNAACTNAMGTFICACTAGFSGDGVAVGATPAATGCTDLDECTGENGGNDCDTNAACTNLPGTFDCECNDGWTGSGQVCSNADECLDGTANCDTNADCVDAPGGFDCACKAGYEGDGTAGTCTDVDECTAGTDTCDANGLCANSVGSFDCTCAPGFLGDGVDPTAVPGALGCTDIDECTDGSNDCDANAACANTPGDFVCTCNGGYTGDGVSCTDVDECTAGTAGCVVAATCANSIGSFACICPGGYGGDGLDAGTGCTDIDECTDNLDNCGPDATCTNSDGSFACGGCAPGYADGVGVCSGADCSHQPCLDFVGVLDASCLSDWSEACAICSLGHDGEIGSCGLVTGTDCPGCLDIDECTDGTADCGVGTCNNLAGDFECVCPSGYTFDGATCVDVDECTDGTDTCNSNAVCTNTTGAFTCLCNTGYQGDAQDPVVVPGASGCLDVNECTDGTNTCMVDATCVNTIGAFTCDCAPGSVDGGLSLCGGDNSCDDPTCGLSVCTVDSECCSAWDAECAACATGGTGHNGVDCSAVIPDCGGCQLQAGDTCAAAFEIAALPYSDAGDTSDFAGQYGFGSGVCAGNTGSGGATSNDTVYSFTPTADGLYFIDVAGFDAAPYVVTDCADIDSTCIGGADDTGSSGTESLAVSLTSGTTYFIIVDGFSNFSNTQGAYTIDVAVCVPSCTDKDCGTDGCGGSCGICGPGNECASGACLPAGTGDTCAAPFVVGALPYSDNGDNTGAGADYGYGLGICPGEAGSGGDGSEDTVYSFTPASTANYTIELSGFDAALYVVTDCADIDNTCVAGEENAFSSGTESMDVNLSAGTTYFIIVDGWSNSSQQGGPYTLTVDASCVPECTGLDCGDDGCGGSCGTCSAGPLALCNGGTCECTPDCTGKACGGDGCGGSCGTCDPGDDCNPAGACVLSGLGDTCAIPFTVGALPFTDNGDSSGAAADYGYGPGVCPGETGSGGDGSNDTVYSFTPTATADYTIEVSGFDASLYVVTDCGDIDNTCVAGEDNQLSGGTESITAGLTADTTYFIIVDGWSNFSNQSGAYTLTVDAACVPECTGLECGDDGCGGSCGTCDAGPLAACDAGTCECTPDCNGKNCGPDGCGGICGTCAPGNNCDTGVCQPPTPGDTCIVPFDVGALPFSDNGDSTTFAGDYGYGPGVCPGETGSGGAGSNDTVYGFTPTATANYTIELVGFDAALYVVTDCGDIDNTCVAGEENTISAPESMDIELTAGTTYFIIVDGYGNSSNQSGAYTLTVDASCVPSCTGLECGDDGCGGSCGTCDGALALCTAGICECTADCTGKTCGEDGCGGSCGTCSAVEGCNPAGTCEALTLGDTCAVPFVVGALPFSDDGDSSTFAADYGYALGVCPGETGSGGDGSNDTVYSFTPGTTDTYTIELGGFDAALYVVTDCADIDNTCVAGEENEFNPGPESMEVTLTADTTYFIIVDGYGNASNQAGPYTLTVTAPPCVPDCTGKVCGGDGCGGSCGLCGPGTACSGDQTQCAVALDLSGYKVLQTDSSKTFTLPANFIVPSGAMVVVGRNADQAAFESFWGALPANAIYLDSGNVIPVLNGAETYSLENAGATVIDGPTIATSSGNNYQLNTTTGAANNAGSWDVAAATAGNGTPGTTTVTPAGIRITEFSDASGSGNFIYEFIEISAQAFAGPVTFDQVAGFFQVGCGMCHGTGTASSGSGSHSIGSSDVTVGHAASQQGSYFLGSPFLKGAAALARIIDGSMPTIGCTPGGNAGASPPPCIDSAQQALIQKWINDGMLAPVP